MDENRPDPAGAPVSPAAAAPPVRKSIQPDSCTTCGFVTLRLFMESVGRREANRKIRVEWLCLNCLRKKREYPNTKKAPATKKNGKCMLLDWKGNYSWHWTKKEAVERAKHLYNRTLVWTRNAPGTPWIQWGTFFDGVRMANDEYRWPDVTRDCK